MISIFFGLDKTSVNEVLFFLMAYRYIYRAVDNIQNENSFSLREPTKLILITV